MKKALVILGIVILVILSIVILVPEKDNVTPETNTPQISQSQEVAENEEVPYPIFDYHSDSSLAEIKTLDYNSGENLSGDVLEPIL